MSKEPKNTSLLESILGSGIEMRYSANQNINDTGIMQIVSNDVYQGLLHYFDTSAPFFQTSIPLQRIVRYKDGSFSSMEKSLKGGIDRHEGFEIIDSMQLAQSLMAHVMPQLSQRLASIYRELIEKNSHDLNQIQNSIILPEINKLKSIAEFVREVSDEIETISRSDHLSTATLVNLQSHRVDLRQTFYTFLNHLDNSLAQPSIETQDVSKNYAVTRYALSNYIVTLVLEHIISGNLDDVSIGRLKDKVTKAFEEMNKVTTNLSNVLMQKHFENTNQIHQICNPWQRQWQWQWQWKLQNLQQQNHGINQIIQEDLKYFDVDNEMKRLEDFIAARHDLLKNVRIQGEGEENITDFSLSIASFSR